MTDMLNNDLLVTDIEAAKRIVANAASALEEARRVLAHAEQDLARAEIKLQRRQTVTLVVSLRSADDVRELVAMLGRNIATYLQVVACSPTLDVCPLCTAITRNTSLTELALLDPDDIKPFADAMRDHASIRTFSVRMPRSPYRLPPDQVKYLVKALKGNKVLTQCTVPCMNSVVINRVLQANKERREECVREREYVRD